MLQPSQRKITLVNRRIVYDFLKFRDATPETFEANEKLCVELERNKDRTKKQKRKKQKSEVEKSKERLDLDIKTTRSMKGNLEKLSLQLQNDFEELMWRVATEKKSSHLPAVEAMLLKRTRDEKLKEIEKLDEVIEDLGKRRKQIGKEK